MYERVRFIEKTHLSFLSHSQSSLRLWFFESGADYECLAQRAEQQCRRVEILRLEGVKAVCAAERY